MKFDKIFLAEFWKLSHDLRFQWFIMYEIENIGLGAMGQHWEIRFISLALEKNCFKSNVRHAIFCVEKYLSLANQIRFWDFKS